MDGFRTARALVLDNDPNEAAPVIEALGGLGVGVLFHTGYKAEELETKHRGIRLLIIDMVLENRGATSSDPTLCISTLIGTLGALLEDDHHPVVVVCWTKHTEFKDLFEVAFKATFPKFRFDTVILFSKDELKKNPEALLEKVKEALACTEPFSLLLEWEQQVHNAATHTTSQVTRLISEQLPDNEKWGELAYKVCAALVIAERGRRAGLEDGSTAATALLAALSPLLADRLEVSGWEKMPSVLGCYERLRLATNAEWNSLQNGRPKSSLLPRGIPSALNAMIHCAPYSKSGEAVPGTIWRVPDDKVEATKLGFLGLGLDWEKFKNEAFDKHPEGKLVPIFVEATPPCDFAQDKASVARLIAGYFVETPGGKPSKANFLWTIGPLLLADIDDFKPADYWLLFSAKHFVTTTRNMTAGWSPIYRLRQSALSNLTACVGSHVSRSGFMTVSA
jgi:hypothetical protein